MVRVSSLKQHYNKPTYTIFVPFPNFLNRCLGKTIVFTPLIMKILIHSLASLYVSEFLAYFWVKHLLYVTLLESSSFSFPLHTFCFHLIRKHGVYGFWGFVFCKASLSDYFAKLLLTHFKVYRYCSRIKLVDTCSLFYRLPRDLFKFNNKL